MINAIIKAFTGRAGWLPSLLVLAIVALTGLATVLGLPRIEQNVGQQVRQYLEINLSDGDSLAGFQISGRDALLSGQINDPATVRAGLKMLPGVRQVVVNDVESIATSQSTSSQAKGEPAGSQAPDSSVDSGVIAPETTSSANLEQDDVSRAQLIVPDRSVADILVQNAATSTASTMPDGVSSPVSGAEAGSPSVASSPRPEAVILSLNELFSESVMFSPKDTLVSAKLRASLASLVGMMKNNPELILGIEGYPDLSVASDKSMFIGFSRARNTEKFLLEQQVEDERIFTRYVSSDPISGDDSAQLKFYILK